MFLCQYLKIDKINFIFLLKKNEEYEMIKP